MIGIIDYGSGNFTSVCNAIASLGQDFFAIDAPEAFDQASHIILPGVGAYNDCIRALKARKLFHPLRSILQGDSKFFLGICVGHQILSDQGTEFQTGEGLGIISGRTTRLEVCGQDRLPHIGWNDVKLDQPSPLFDGIENGASFYFVHSFNLNANNSSVVIATTHHSQKITAAVNYKKAYGVQFHPEKSQKNGLQLLENFSNLS